MIDIEVKLEGDDLVAFVGDLRKQIPYATSVAINRTAEEVLAEARRQIQGRFIVRAPSFLLPPTQLPAKWKATKSRLSARVALGDDDGGRAGIGARRRAILDKFEFGGPKEADDPDFPIAIPTRAIRPSPTTLVARALYPKNLRLAPRKQADGSTLAAKRKGKVRGLAGEILGVKKRKELGLQGIGGTFTMHDSNGKPLGVFQRTGAGFRGYRMIWAFRNRIPIPKRLTVYARAQQIVDTRFQANFDGALDLAIRTAR